MTNHDQTTALLLAELTQLREQLIEAEEIIRALRAGEADALVVSGPEGPQVYTLKGAEHPYRVLIETMNEGALTLQETGVILYANARFAELVGVPLAKIIGKPFARFVAPADQLAFAALLVSGLADRSSGALLLSTTTGTPLPVQISLRALHDESVTHGCMIITDMSRSLAASAQIRSALAEKELLLREIHHRVKNNLQIITSLLRLQARNVDEDHIKQVLLDSQSRIGVMALVHEHLYHSESLAAIDIGDYLRSLSSSVYRAYAAQSSAIHFDCHIAVRLALNPDLAIPLGLIVTELLMNSIKHAFPDERSGLLQVQASINDTDLLVMVVDNGVGFMPHEGPPTSLGLEIVTSLARQINAHIHFDHTCGTRVELRVSLKQLAI